jgi:hypothetical protein
MPKTVYQELFAELLKGDLSSTFRKAGFKRKGNNFFRECPGAWQVINFQNFPWNTATRGEFVINIGIDLKSPGKKQRSRFPPAAECELCSRCGGYVGRDLRCEISDDADVARIRENLIVFLRMEVFPFLKMFSSEDRIIHSLREDICYGNKIYSDQILLPHLLRFCKKHGEIELGLRVIDDYQFSFNFNDDQSELAQKQVEWLEFLKKNLKGEDSVAEVRARNEREKRYCTADPKAEIIELVDWMNLVEENSNSSESLGWKAYVEAGKLADKGYVPVIKELILLEKKAGRKQSLYTILGILGRNLQSSAIASYLIERLPMETNKYVLQYMLIGITTIPKDSGVDMKAVIDLTEDKRWQVGLTAIEALNKAGDPAVEGKLIEICSSERNRYDITAAMRNLNLIGTPRAIPTLETLLKSRSRNIRGVAEAAIDAIRNRESDGKT